MIKLFLEKHKEFIIYFTAALAIIIFYPKWTVDDSAILFRYADNFRNHSQLNWNVGEYFEGYTGVLLLLILIVSPLKYIITAYAIGALSYLFGGYVLYKYTRNRAVRILVMISYLSAPALLTHAFSGLETMLFIFLFLLALYAFREGKDKLIYLSLILISLARPEGVLFSLLILASVRKKNISVIYLIFIGAYLIFKFYYYGNVLPNSFYHKGLAPQQFKSNLIEFSEYFLLYLSVPLIIINYGYRKRLIKIQWWIPVMFAAVIMYYLNCHLAMNYSYRFYIQMFPLVLIMMASVQSLPNKLVLPLIILQLSFYAYSLNKELNYINDERMINNDMVQTANFIDANYTKNKKLCVYTDAGYIPFLTKMETLDLNGLLNKEITENEYKNNHSNYDLQTRCTLTFIYKLNYLYSFNPDVLVISSNYSDSPNTGVFTQLMLSDSRFRQFEFIKKYGSTLSSGQKYYQFIYEKIL